MDSNIQKKSFPNKVTPNWRTVFKLDHKSEDYQTTYILQRRFQDMNMELFSLYEPLISPYRISRTYRTMKTVLRNGFSTGSLDGAPSGASSSCDIFRLCVLEPIKVSRCPSNGQRDRRACPGKYTTFPSTCK